jgi:hypothetical protein
VIRFLALALALLIAAPAAGGPSLRLAWQPQKPRPGDAVWLAVEGAPPTAIVTAALAGQSLLLFRHGKGHGGVLGIDLETRPGPLEWRLTVEEPGHPSRGASGKLTVLPRTFSVQRLTLPPDMVLLDPATERRAEAEAERLRAVYRSITPDRLWRGSFRPPLGSSEPGNGFGSRRIINGLPRAPHGGTDYAAATGTPVLAVNAGRVALIGEYFFAGRLVVIDHGLALHTLYFHLDSIAVAEGDRVDAGQAIGTVGATGRATGPHLHFGVQVGAARIDPATLLGLGLPE